jgi:hypothetical protein
MLEIADNLQIRIAYCAKLCHLRCVCCLRLQREREYRRCHRKSPTKSTRQRQECAHLVTAPLLHTIQGKAPRPKMLRLHIVNDAAVSANTCLLRPSCLYEPGANHKDLQVCPCTHENVGCKGHCRDGNTTSTFDAKSASQSAEAC